MDRQKQRFTFSPILRCGPHLPNWKPMIISKIKGARWSNLVKLETKTIEKADGSEFTLERRVFISENQFYILCKFRHSQFLSISIVWEIWEIMRNSQFLGISIVWEIWEIMRNSQFFGLLNSSTPLYRYINSCASILPIFRC